MAEPSRRRLPATFQREGVAHDHVMRDVRGTEGCRERNPDYTSVSEVDSENSENSMSSEELADDDLLDLEEEYHKEMEEERLADEKNGHFTESPPPESHRNSARRGVAAHVLETFARVARSSLMNLDRNASPAENEKSGGDSQRISRARLIDSQAVTSEIHGSNWDVEKDHLNSSVQLGVTTRGEIKSAATIEELHEFEKSIMPKDIQPISMFMEEDLGGLAESSNGSYGETHGSKCDEMEDEYLPHGGVIEHANLDLLEARTFATQQHTTDPNWGLHAAAASEHHAAAGGGLHAVDDPSPNAAAVSSSKAQVNHLITSPNSLQNAHTPAQNKINSQPVIPIPHINSQPKLMTPLPASESSSAHIKLQNKKHLSKPPLPRIVAQTFPTQPAASTHKQSITAQPNSHSHPHRELNNNTPTTPKPSSSAKDKQPSEILISGPPNTALNMGKPASSERAQEGFVRDEIMEDFPPLASSAVVRRGVHVGGNKDGSMQDVGVDQIMQNVIPVIHLPTAQAANRDVMADMMDTDQPRVDAADLGSAPGQSAAMGAASGAQPSIHFGRSMADVLRSGQPAEGPIFLDREKAEKRGEVRIVEGKPCLYFSANETSLLAGRLGPAIVGKFSHSIPPAHQIQKALGNLKLVGAMSWNFLNAKHVFIQLSDMRDYVKILNGPNNLPVWYIEHHPMRVFKWTPDFDPFFESPITTAWCNILALPVHLFEESALIAIGEMLGKPVQVDRATISRSRVSFARICVEVDLSRPIVEEIDINIAGKQVTLKVKWEKIPLYCNECKHVGHGANTCYAAGKRPMPPKRDYTRGPPTPQSRPPPHSEGEARPPNPRQEPRPSSTPAERRRQPQAFRQQAYGSKDTERPAHVGGQRPRQEGHYQEKAAGARPPSSGFFHGSSSTAAEGGQAVSDDGFVDPTKKKSSKLAKARQRYRENRRARRQAHGALPRRASDGEEAGGTEADRSSTESDRGARSLSPPPRAGSGVGPLAMVLHGNNMFGALADEPSDENADSDAQKDYRMMPSDTRIMHFVRPGGERVDQSISSSPPLGGTPKRARLAASRTQ